MTRISPHRWYTDKADEAAAFYASKVEPGKHIRRQGRTEHDPSGGRSHCLGLGPSGGSLHRGEPRHSRGRPPA